MKQIGGHFVDLEKRDPINRLSRNVGARAEIVPTQIRIRLHVLFFLSVIAPLNDPSSNFTVIPYRHS